MHDVIAIGGGATGTCTALRARQLGLTSIALEKGGENTYLCNTRYSQTVFHVGYRDPKSTPAELRKALDDLSGNWADASLLDLMANNASRAVDWLESLGVDFTPGKGYRARMIAPPRPDVPGLVWRGVGGDALLDLLEKVLVAAGSGILRGHRCVSIERTRQGFALEVQADGGMKTFETRCVVLADGGFQGSQAMLGKYVSPYPERLFLRSTDVSKGDALNMAMGLGGTAVGLEYFYGHFLCDEVVRNDRLWPMPWLDRLVEAGALVDSRGERFVEESNGGIQVANTAARHPHADKLFVVFDKATWESVGANISTGIVSPNPHLEASGATVHRADTVEELARRIGLPAHTLAATVSDYNRKLETSAAVASPKGVQPRPIVTAPFHAIGAVVGITNTTGGIKVDDRCRVLREAGGVVEGLYAAGTACGGFDGGPRTAYTGGLTRCVITALAAAEHAAEFTKH